jgi:two-component system sensor histidine kinase PhoQ
MTEVNLPKSINRSHIFNSLKARLIASALLLILVLMPLIGLTLNDAFKLQIKTAAKNELSAYIYSVLAVAEVDNNQLVMPEYLLDNQFNVIESGLYALITMPVLENHTLMDSGSLSPAKVPLKKAKQRSKIIWHSASFLGLQVPYDLTHPAPGENLFSEIRIKGKPYLIYSFSARFEQRFSASKNTSSSNQPFSMTIHIIKDQANIQFQIKQFSKQLWSWLLILMSLLVIVQLVWLWWTLRPLAKFTQELSSIERGHQNQLSERYPTELQSVAQQLNTLLNTEQNQRKRYRNALSDLAHSLKTPLAVIQSQKGLSHSSIEQVGVINRIIGHQLKRAQSAADASWHLGTKVSLVSEKLVRVLAKIYREPQILITQEVDQETIFKGDEADLTEILGNVLDNACKAAKSQVLLTIISTETGVVMTVEDDGKGISVEQQTEIFKRGIRADSYQQGHGVGLAIVRDLVDSYHGQLSVSQSEKLGGAKFEFRFGEKTNL